MRQTGLVLLLSGLLLSKKSFFFKYCVFMGIFFFLYLVTPSGEVGLLLASTVPKLALMPFTATPFTYTLAIGPAAFAITYRKGSARYSFFAVSAAMLGALACLPNAIGHYEAASARSQLAEMSTMTMPQNSFESAELIGFHNERRCQTICRTLLIDQRYNWVRVTYGKKPQVIVFALRKDCLDPDVSECIGFREGPETTAQLIAEKSKPYQLTDDPWSRKISNFQTTGHLTVRNQAGQVYAQIYGLTVAIPRFPALPIKNLMSDHSFDPVPSFLSEIEILSIVDAKETLVALNIVPATLMQRPEQEIDDEGFLVERRGTAVKKTKALPPDSTRTQYIANLLEDPQRKLSAYERSQVKTWISLMENASDIPPYIVDFVQRTLLDPRVPKDTIWSFAKPMQSSDLLARRLVPLALSEIEKGQDSKNAGYFIVLLEAYTRKGATSTVLMENKDAYLRAMEDASPEIRPRLVKMAEHFG